ncbi:MAG: NAD-dependent epimerase/dehydratase family protein [Kineosporiaceae bacterium]
MPTSRERTATPKTRDLTVAVTGPTGTFGFGFVPLLQADPRITRVVGIARRPFDPAQHGWTKMTYRQGDVRDPAALREAFQGADVVVHLAFLVTGAGGRASIRAVNVEGTLNAFRAAAAAGAQRFVYASSVAAYGFHPDNPLGMTEDWPVRPAARLFYAQEKAELELLLQGEADAHPEIGLYLLRPPVVLGPHTTGGKEVVPGSASLGRALLAAVRRSPLPVVVPVAPLPLQLIHEDDVGQALLLCAVAAGPAGAYNITGDGVLTLTDVAREVGLVPLPVPTRLAQSAARLASAVPLPPPVPPATEWVEALSHPSIMDAGKAKRELGWSPRYSSMEALRAALDTSR